MLVCYYTACSVNMIDMKTTNNHGILICDGLKLFSSERFTPATCIFQMTMSAIPSFLDDNSENTFMPLDKTFYHSGRDHCNIHEAEVLLQAPNDPVEPVDSSFISPVTQQPYTSVPMHENTTHVPHSITNPGCANGDPFLAQSMTSEMPHMTCPDPLLAEMERIEKVKKEAFKIREKKV